MTNFDATLTVALINMLLAWSMWFPLTGGQISFGAIGSAAAGSYISGYLAINSELNVVLVLLVGAGSGLAVGVIMAVIATRLHEFAFAVATLGVAEMIRISLSTVETFGGASGMVGVPPMEGILWIAGAACVVVAVATVVLFRSSFGRAIDTLAEDEVQVRALGMSPALIKLALMSGAGLVAGVAGALQGAYTQYVDGTQFTITVSILLLSYVVLGGVNSQWGAFAGAAVLTIVNQELGALGNGRIFVYPAVLLAVMLLRPDGALLRSKRLRSRRQERALETAS